MQRIFVFFDGILDRAKPLLEQLDVLQEQYPHERYLVDIAADRSTYNDYLGKTPVVEIGPYRLASPITAAGLEATLRSDARRAETRPASLTRWSRSDSFGAWLASHYLLVINLILALYVGLPFLAPALQRVGWESGARAIQRVYSPLCHQLAFRSWFLFGEQPAYPRALAHIPGWKTYEEATGLDSRDLLAAKAYLGNPQLGYKVAFCERDVAIYGGMLAFGLFFSLTGRRIKAIPWYVWLAAGILPVLVDGASQLPSLVGISLPWLPVRESTPFLRTLTGMLFGVSTAWYGLPLFEESMRESRVLINKKLLVLKRELV